MKFPSYSLVEVEGFQALLSTARMKKWSLMDGVDQPAFGR